LLSGVAQTHAQFGLVCGFSVFGEIIQVKLFRFRAPEYWKTRTTPGYLLSFASIQAGAAFRENVGSHLTAAKRAEIEKLAAGFHPNPMEMLHELMQKRAAQPK
jgi:hypothetical protein